MYAIVDWRIVAQKSRPVVLFEAMLIGKHKRLRVGPVVLRSIDIKVLPLAGETFKLAANEGITVLRGLREKSLKHIFFLRPVTVISTGTAKIRKVLNNVANLVSNRRFTRQADGNVCSLDAMVI